MLNYLIQTLLISGIFIALYKTVIIKSNWFVFNRIYLILTPIIALLVPLITFKEMVYVERSGIASQAQNFMETVSEEQSTNYLLISLSAVYFSTLFAFLVRFSRNLIGIQKSIRKHRRVKEDGLNYILIEGEEGSHTFLNNIFLSKKDFENNSIDKYILNHEKAHAEQLHSLDLLFIEILTSVFWFNPNFWILRNSIKLNHEFLADSAVLKQGAALEQYSLSLLECSTRNKALLPIANHYNHQQLKKRIKSMNMKTTSSQKRINLLLLMLLFGISIWAFSSTEKEYIYTEQTLIQEGATPEEIKEYNSLAKKLTSNNPGDLIIKKKDIDRMNFIYEKMSVAQRSSAVALPKLPPPPPAPPQPGVSQKEMDEYNAIALRYQNSKSKVYKKEDYERMFQIRKRMSPKQKEGALKMPPPPPPPSPATQKSSGELNTIANEQVTDKKAFDTMYIDDVLVLDNKANHMEVKTKDNPPIVYVDGVYIKEYDLNKISPDAIESITVLKDKSAIQKYGPKGKNGVILITTKAK